MPLFGLKCRFCDAKIQWFADHPDIPFKTDGICEPCERKIALLIKDVPDPEEYCVEREPRSGMWCGMRKTHVEDHAVTLEGGERVTWRKL